MTLPATWYGRPPARPRRLVVLAALFAGMPCLVVAGCTGAPRVAAASGPAVSDRTAAASPAPVARNSSRKASTLALRLMRQAAQAAVLTDYQGEETSLRSDAGGETFLISNISHTGAGPTVTQTLTAGPTASTQPYVSSDADPNWPEGVLGVTTPLVQLLARNYVVTYGGRSVVGNLPAELVEAWRGDNSLAAKFWLDVRTRLPLEREVFDPGTHVISLGMFVNVKIGGLGPERAQAPVLSAGPAAQAWKNPLTPPDLLAMAHHGWAVPSVLPGGLTLFAGSQAATRTGPVLDLAYSDGLYVVSVFEQHGNLAPRLSGWQRTKLDGVVVYAAVPDQHSFAWTGKGIVYTLIADAPAQLVSATVRTLPHDRPPGFWHRVGHGLAKLADLVNPFG